LIHFDHRLHRLVRAGWRLDVYYDQVPIGGAVAIEIGLKGAFSQEG
jgi:hypothetical protein